MAGIHGILSGDGGREPPERDQWSEQLAGEECEWVSSMDGVNQWG